MKEKEVAAAETKSFDSAFDQDSDDEYQTSDSEGEKPQRQASRGQAASACVVFPSSSSLNGHPDRPGNRATGGGARPGARGPGRGPTVVWAQPGCWGFLSPKLQSEVLVGVPSVTLLSSSQVAKAPYCALLSAQPRPAAGRAT